MFQPFQPWLPGPPLRSDGTPWHWPPARKSRNPKLDGDINNYDSCTMEKNSWRGEKLHLFKQNSRILPVKLLIQCSPCSMFLFCSIGIDELYKIRPSWILPARLRWIQRVERTWTNTSMKHVQTTARSQTCSKWNHPKLIWLRKWDGRGIWSCSEAKRCEAPEYQKPSQYQWFNGCP